jgi:hypothetical protein
VDTTGPAVPTITLASDTGSYSNDFITKNGQMNVTLSGDTSGWQYSSNGGASWVTGVGTSFILPEGDYSAGGVKVKAFDSSGNTSIEAQTLNTIYVDKTAPVDANVTLTLSSEADPYLKDLIFQNNTATGLVLNFKGWDKPGNLVTNQVKSLGASSQLTIVEQTVSLFLDYTGYWYAGNGNDIKWYSVIATDLAGNESLFPVAEFTLTSNFNTTIYGSHANNNLYYFVTLA